MSEKTVSNLQLVSFTFSIKDESGTTLEQSPMPMDYLHGNMQMFPKIEAALEGKKVGDEVEVTMTPAETFGEHDPDLILTDNVDNVPAEYRYVGARPIFHNDRGEKLEFVVTEINDGKIVLDANHPYAGKSLTFHIKIEGIRTPTDAELQHGMQVESPNLQ